MNKAKRKEILRVSLRVLLYQIGFGFFGLLFASMLVSSSAGLRVPVVGLIIMACGALMFMEGSYRGEKDCAMADTLEKLGKKGAYAPTDAENAKCFWRAKGVISSLVGALPLLLIAAYVALTTEPYVYSLQDLPGWMAAYLPRAEIGGALAYLADTGVAATLTDYLRIAVRFVLFPYVGLFGEMSDAMSLLFDRISPLIVLVMPAVMAIGYQFGPARRKKSVKMIDQAKATPRRRLKKEAKQKLAPEKKQII